jgi:hypothetical protein
LEAGSANNISKAGSCSVIALFSSVTFLSEVQWATCPASRKAEFIAATSSSCAEIIRTEIPAELLNIRTTRHIYFVFNGCSKLRSPSNLAVCGLG